MPGESTFDSKSDQFVWHDGGRASSGFVGLAGDCVTRAIAIATGRAYRDIYQAIGERALKSPRQGVLTTVSAEFLNELGWQHHVGSRALVDPCDLPDGVVIVHVRQRDERGGHMFAVIDHVIHDTWNACEDDCYLLFDYWTPPPGAEHSTSVAIAPKQSVSEEQELTQREFDKILKRLRALDNTASNSGSTEGEKRNALRMMQSLMLTHNLSREDIVDQENVEHVQFTRMACPLNGRKAYAWEKSLAFYIVHHVFPSVQYYLGTRGHRTFFWFYGPVEDVKNTIALFRELLLTIAAAARLKYGSYARGSGASYAEGYVAGLPRDEPQITVAEPNSDETKLIQLRTMALNSAAKKWLAQECNTQLVSSRGRGRSRHDPSAASRGKKDGAQQDVNFQGRRARITHRG